MQSILLISSLVLSSPVSVANLDNAAELTSFVSQEVSNVREQVQYKTKVSIESTDFFQVRTLAKLAKMAKEQIQTASVSE